VNFIFVCGRVRWGAVCKFLKIKKVPRSDFKLYRGHNGPKPGSAPDCRRVKRNRQRKSKVRIRV